jgi:hypothetical protein
VGSKRTGVPGGARRVGFPVRVSSCLVLEEGSVHERQGWSHLNELEPISRARLSHPHVFLERISNQMWQSVHVDSITQIEKDAAAEN